MTSTNIPVWENGVWEGVPRLEGEVDADVCVVGLGGSGLAAVDELLGAGQRVVGIDAGVVGGGAAGRNGGFLLAGLAAFYHDAVAAHGRERARAIYRHTLEGLDRMERETPDVMRRVGSLRIAMTREEVEDCRRQLDAMRADGLPAEWYEGPEGVGLRIPGDGVFQPLARCRILARRAVEAGARLFEHSPAVEVTGTEVRTPAGRVRCERVVVAVDGWLERLLPELEGRVRTVRLQMLATAPTDEVRFPLPVYARYGYEYWQQLPDGRIVLGGFRDRGGEGEWGAAPVPAEPVQGALEAFLREELGVDAPITHRWAASVGYTPDGLPILEEVRDGVWVAGGYNGTGNVVGMLSGRAAARLALGRPSAFARALRDSTVH